MDIDTGKTKYIFVIGGVMSGVGKGVTTASISTVLESAGYRVSPIKADPYLNVDAGTMNPTEHGEVFVLDSGLECDQDMGNYERFLNRSLPPDNYMTNGMVFQHVIEKERALGYDGKCVEPTYHITEEIIRRITKSSRETNADITIVEIGGTVGEYQNAIFIEASRRIKQAHPQDVLFAMVSYLPTPPSIGEMKTKPTQNAVRQLNSYGVAPNLIIGRAETPLDEKRKQKIADMCGVAFSNVISAPDVDSIYEMPLNFSADDIGEQILNFFDLKIRDKNLDDWQKFVDNQKTAQDTVKVGIVGKYFATGDFKLSDAYISVIEAINISAAHMEVIPEIAWLDASDFESKNNKEELARLEQFDGIIVPGGFGKTGIEGKIAAIEYVRKQKIPFLGLCYGMQLAVVELARHVAGLSDAHTTEIDEDTSHPVIDVMPEQKENMMADEYGGTMRLGTYPAELAEGSIAHNAYGTDKISERHRHRFEVNNEYLDKLKEAGMTFSGVSPDGKLVEIAELPEDQHPFFLGTQFHPEFMARVLSPHPLYSAFLTAALEN